MSTLFSDVRYAIRSFSKIPGLAVIAVATLAIGIGANTAIFSIINTVLLRPPAFREPAQLVRLYETEAAPGRYPFAGPDFIDWKNQNSTFQDMALFTWAADMNLSGEGEPERVLATSTSWNFFSVLGVNPAIGRAFAAGEDQPGKLQVAILSHGLWRSRFVGDPGAVGQTIELNSRKYTIIGVAPQDFQFPQQAQLWIPLDMSSEGLGNRGNHWAAAIGRLKPGLTIEKAQSDLSVIAARLEQQYPDSNHKVGAAVVSLHEDMVGRLRPALVMSLVAVGLVALIACANVANLLLSRAVARQKEMAVRTALGAGRWDLLRQLLTESVVLATAGGALGLLVGWGAIQAFAKSTLAVIPQFKAIRMDGTVLLFTCALAMVTAILFGIYPAIRTSRPDLHDELKGGAGSSVSPGRHRRFTSNALVVCEFALSVMLLASAGVLLKDLVRLRAVDTGVRKEGVWTAAVRLPEANYADASLRNRFADRLREQCNQVAGVRNAAITDRLPVEGGSNYYINIRGRASRLNSGVLVERHAVSPEYFDTMGVRLLKGRLFTAEDVQRMRDIGARIREFRKSGARPTPELSNSIVTPAVITDVMARTFWPNEDPLGQMFSNSGSNGPWRQVIGVVNDVRQRGLATKPVPEAYDVIDASSRFFVVLHTCLPPESVTADVRRTLRGMDARLPLFMVRTMDQVIEDNAVGQRFLSTLIGVFAGIAALLAAIGIYGVLSYVVTQRTREIAIRMALGASRGRVLAGILGEGGRLALFGLIAGVMGALAAGRVQASLLTEVKPWDPVVIAGTAVTLAAVALIACFVPARRAARLEPTRALRYE